MKSDELQKQVEALDKRVKANELVTKELANRVDAALAVIARLTELEDMRKYFAPHWTPKDEQKLVDAEYKQIINSHHKIHYTKSKKKA